MELVPVLNETTQAFYISLNETVLMTTDANNLRAGDRSAALSRVGSRFATDVGLGCDGDFGQCSSGPRFLNGKISISNMNVFSSTSPTASPNNAPSSGAISNAPTSSPTIQCSADQDVFTLKLNTDEKASELSWQIVDEFHHVMSEMSPPYSNGVQTYKYQFCLDTKACYRFVLRDSAGDGIPGEGKGATVSWKGHVQMKPVPGNSPAFFSTGIDFGDMCLPDGGAIAVLGQFGLDAHFGNMFDIKSKQNIVIRRLSLNIVDTESYGLKVYTKNGSFKGYENDPSAWTLVHSATITGSGSSLYTATGNFDAGTVPILSETTQAFYVVLDGPGLGYVAATSLQEGQVWKQFSAIDVMVGTVNNMNFGSFIRGAGFEGKITYAALKTNTCGMDVTNDISNGGDKPDNLLPEEYINIPARKVRGRNLL